jgi:hypothetical protein
MEPCGTSACISRGMGILPSTVTLNIQLDRNDLMSLFMLVEVCNLEKFI